jgi:hypothetical protein
MTLDDYQNQAETLVRPSACIATFEGLLGKGEMQTVSDGFVLGYAQFRPVDICRRIALLAA